MFDRLLEIEKEFGIIALLVFTGSQPYSDFFFMALSQPQKMVIKSCFMRGIKWASPQSQTDPASWKNKTAIKHGKKASMLVVDDSFLYISRLDVENQSSGDDSLLKKMTILGFYTSHMIFDKVMQCTGLLQVFYNIL